MGTWSIWHWLIVLAVVLLMFGGRGKISQLMGDFGKGLSAFKKGVSGDKEQDAAAAAARTTTPGDDAKIIGQGASTDPAPATAGASAAPKEQVKT